MLSVHVSRLVRETFRVRSGEALLAGDASVVAAAFLRERLAGEGDAPVGTALLAGGASAAAAAFLRGCLTGDGEGVGDSAFTMKVPARPMAAKRAKSLVCMN